MASARYNGIRLPLLPEEAENSPTWLIEYWTTEEVGGLGGKAVLYCFDSLPTKVDDYNNNGLDYAWFPDGTVRKTYETPFPYNNGDWKLINTATMQEPYVTPCESLNFVTISNLTFARDDGTVLITACEPVINADESFLLGIAVGMGLKGW
jgi:hypothetical protein